MARWGRMRRLTLVLLFATATGCAHGGLTADGQPDDAESLLIAAATWERGRPVPESLLAYRPREDCILAQYETAALFGKVHNAELLAAIVAHPGADEEAARFALERALVVEGPSRVFERLEGLALPRFARARMGEPNVWVSHAVAIDEADKSAGVARRIVLELMDRVGGGEPFESVYADISREHAKLVNLGEFVLSPGHTTAMPLRDVEVPPDHVAELLDAEPGDLVLLTAETPHHGNRFVVYAVEETYRPGGG